MSRHAVWTRNALYWETTKIHVFCSSIPFQRALMHRCNSNRWRDIADFLRLKAPTPIQILETKIGKNSLFTVSKSCPQICSLGYSLLCSDRPYYQMAVLGNHGRDGVNVDLCHNCFWHSSLWLQFYGL